MRNTNTHGIEGNSIRMDRIVIVDRLLLEDGHDRPCAPILVRTVGNSVSCVRITWGIRGCVTELYYKHEHDEHP